MSLRDSPLLLKFPPKTTAEFDTPTITTAGSFHVVRWCPFRKCTKHVVIHQDVWNSGIAYNVTIKENQEKTAYLVLPNGDKALLYIYGARHSRGRWADDFYGLFMITVFDNIRQYVLIDHNELSHGGGIGHRLWLLAVPSDLPLDMPIGVVRRDIAEKHEENFVLFADGKMIPEAVYDTIREFENYV